MMTAQLDVPGVERLLYGLHALAESDVAVARCLEAVKTGSFKHPDGRRDDLRTVVPSLEQLAVISHFARECPTVLSVEVGFGMGSTASIIAGARRSRQKPFRHVAFDPFGLADGRGVVVEDYLRAEFGVCFDRVRKRSEVGLALLLEEAGPGSAGLAFIDGGHTFENVMTDFVLSDLLCCVGGTIVMDDAWYPAIETVINYVRSNRPDYALAYLPVANTAVLQKRERDSRPWYGFRPFDVPQRLDWTSVKDQDEAT